MRVLTKKILAVMLIFSLSAGLAACSMLGGTTEADTTVSESETETETTASEPETTEPEAETVQPTQFDPTEQKDILKLKALADAWDPLEASADNAVLSYISDALYCALTSEDGRKTALVPGMAAGDPVDLTEVIAREYPDMGIPDGEKSGYAYVVPLKQGCCFADGTKIDANTFVDSLHLLLQPGMNHIRASWVLGGGLLPIAGTDRYIKQGTVSYKPVTVRLSAEDDLSNVMIDARQYAGLGYVSENGDPIPEYFSVLSEIRYGRGPEEEPSDPTESSDPAESTEPETVPGPTETAAEPTETAAEPTETAAEAESAESKPEGETEGEETEPDEQYPISGRGLWEAYLASLPEPVEGEEDKPLQTPLFYAEDNSSLKVGTDELGLWASGEYELTVVLSEKLPAGALKKSLNILSDILVNPEQYKALGSDYGRRVGRFSSFGPYLLTQGEAGSDLQLTRNLNWYGWDEMVYIKEIRNAWYCLFPDKTVYQEIIIENAP